MKFCSKCGSIMLPKKDGAKNIFACACGYVESSTKVRVSETVEKPKEVEVVDGDYETLPLTEETCEKCGCKEAYFWEIQTRASDEAATKFLRCKDCKHTWRDYS